MKGFVEEQAHGQHWLRLVFPDGAANADIRLFLRGELLDGTRGRAIASRERLVSVLGERLPLIAPKQVHGVTVLDSTEENAIVHDAKPPLVEADGILLDSSRVEGSLRFADCAPVVVASTTGRSWVLMLHSGYKGTVQNIVKAGLDKVRSRYGTDSVASACAWVGPCIGGASYPRDREEWTERGQAVFHEKNVRETHEKVFFDIAGEIGEQLSGCGVAPGRIFLSGVDTFDCGGRCYSYRGGDREDRMFLWARLGAGATK